MLARLGAFPDELGRDRLWIALEDDEVAIFAPRAHGPQVERAHRNAPLKRPVRAHDHAHRGLETAAVIAPYEGRLLASRLLRFYRYLLRRGSDRKGQKKRGEKAGDTPQNWLVSRAPTITPVERASTALSTIWTFALIPNCLWN